MSFRHLWAVTKKETSHIIRDRYTLFLVTLSPTLLLLLMAYALSVDISHVPVVVWDQDQSSLSRSFIQEITSGEDVDLYKMVSSMDEVEMLLQKGKIKAAVIIGPRFADEINRLTSVPLQMIIDGTEPESG
ncbi:MAG: ABC transporter permease, partial [Anaerolineales bacterium]